MNSSANDKIWTVIQTMAPLDVLLVPRGATPAEETWYRIPSWRVEFDCDTLRGFDIRLHKSLDGPSGWALSEATTGHKIYEGWDDEDEPGTSTDALVEFVELLLPKLDRAKMEAAMEKARSALKERSPAPIPMPREWIEEAKCDHCGGVGWRAIQVEAGVFEQDQCQWCFEQWLALGQPAQGGDNDV